MTLFSFFPFGSVGFFFQLFLPFSFSSLSQSSFSVSAFLFLPCSPLSYRCLILSFSFCPSLSLLPVFPSSAFSFPLSPIPKYLSPFHNLSKNCSKHEFCPFFVSLSLSPSLFLTLSLSLSLSLSLTLSLSLSLSLSHSVSLFVKFF